MHLPSGAVEYAHITFSENVSGYTVEASTDGQATWLPTLPGDTVFEVKFLLRGPTAPGSDGHPITATTTLYARITDSPEIIPIPAGVIVLD